MFQIQCVTSGKLSHFFFLFKIWNLGAELRSLYSSVLIWARYHFCLIFIESSFNILISSSGSYSHFLHCLLNKPSRMCLLCVFGFMYILLRYTLWYNTCTCFKLNVMYCTPQCVYFLLFFSLTFALFRICLFQTILLIYSVVMGISPLYRWISIYMHLYRLVQKFLWDIHTVVRRRAMG